MSDVRQAAWWTRLLADPGEARGMFVADDEDMGVVGFGSCGPVRDPPEGLDGTEMRVGEVYTLYVEPDFQNHRARAAACSTRCSASSAPTAATPPCCGCWPTNPTRFFYEGLGGERVGERVDTMAGTDVEEIAFAWRDLDVPLVRRKLATEED